MDNDVHLHNSNYGPVKQLMRMLIIMYVINTFILNLNINILILCS